MFESVQKNYFDVFISHQSGDHPIAERIKTELEGRGYKCFMSEKDVQFLPYWREKEFAALRKTVDFILIVSEKILDERHEGLRGEIDVEVKNYQTINNSRSSRYRGAMIAIMLEDMLNCLPSVCDSFRNDSIVNAFEEKQLNIDNIIRGLKSPEENFAAFQNNLSLLYPQNTNTNLQKVSYHISPEIDCIPDDYYVNPSNFVIDLEINNKQIVAVYERRTDSENNLQTENHYCMEKEHFGAYSNAITNLTNKIKKCIEYKHPNASFRSQILCPTWTDGMKKDFWRLSILDVVSVYNHVVIKARKHKRKTLFLKWLIKMLVKSYDQEIDITVPMISDSFFSSSMLPVYFVASPENLNSIHHFIKDNYLFSSGHNRKIDDEKKKQLFDMLFKDTKNLIGVNPEDILKVSHKISLSTT